MHTEHLRPLTLFARQHTSHPKILPSAKASRLICLRRTCGWVFFPFALGIDLVFPLFELKSEIFINTHNLKIVGVLVTPSV